MGLPSYGRLQTCFRRRAFPGHPVFIKLFLWIGISVTLTSKSLRRVLDPISYVYIPSALQPTPRGVAMCAQNARALRLAWTQIMALRTLHAMEADSFTIFHADELNFEDSNTARAMARLTALPNVEIKNLLTWYSAAYGNDTDGLNGFKGYFCKVGALLAAPHDMVAVIDLDVALMANPFSLLMDSAVFRNHGHYLFCDRRITLKDGESTYIGHLEKQWRRYHPGKEKIEASELLRSPPFTGWSHDYGESAVVLMDKSRNMDALTILEQMVAPDSIDASKEHVHGDKESYWQALALADQHIGMNSYAWTAVGSKTTEGDACCHKNTLAQWVWLSSRPEIFYLNGDGVEDLISGTDSTLLTSFVSRPIDYYHPKTQTNSFCSPEAMPIPDTVLQTLNAYQLLYDDF